MIYGRMHLSKSLDCDTIGYIILSDIYIIALFMPLLPMWHTMCYYNSVSVKKRIGGWQVEDPEGSLDKLGDTQ